MTARKLLFKGFNPRPALMPGEFMATWPLAAAARFQSTPGINAGRIVALRAVTINFFSFNPRPALMPGEFWGDSRINKAAAVSIHARH